MVTGRNNTYSENKNRGFVKNNVIIDDKVFTLAYDKDTITITCNNTNNISNWIIYFSIPVTTIYK